MILLVMFRQNWNRSRDWSHLIENVTFLKVQENFKNSDHVCSFTVRVKNLYLNQCTLSSAPTLSPPPLPPHSYVCICVYFITHMHTHTHLWHFNCMYVRYFSNFSYLTILVTHHNTNKLFISWNSLFLSHPKHHAFHFFSSSLSTPSYFFFRLP